MFEFPSVLMASESRLPYWGKDCSPRQMRKREKMRNVVVFVAVPDLDEHLSVPWKLDSPVVFPVCLEVLHDHTAKHEMSDYMIALTGLDYYEVLGMEYSGADALEWLKGHGLTLFQKFAARITNHYTRDYFGESDMTTEVEILWRGPPDTAALEQYMARSSLLWALEQRAELYS